MTLRRVVDISFLTSLTFCFDVFPVSECVPYIAETWRQPWRWAWTGRCVRAMPGLRTKNTVKNMEECFKLIHLRSHRGLRREVYHRWTSIHTVLDKCGFLCTFCSVFTPGPFSRAAHSVFTVSLTLMWRGINWWGHELRPNHAHQLCLIICLGRTLVLHNLLVCVCTLWTMKPIYMYSGTPLSQTARVYNRREGEYPTVL